MFGSKIITGTARKATKSVTYPFGGGVIKTLAVGTRNSNLSKKEAKKQTRLLEEQNKLLNKLGKNSK